MIKKSYKVAFGGVVAALSLVLMFLTGIIPFGTYDFPSLAGMALVLIAIELGYRYAFMVYAVVALLSVFFVPDKEAAMFFVLILGYYPVLKGIIEGKILPLESDGFQADRGSATLTQNGIRPLEDSAIAAIQPLAVLFQGQKVIRFQTTADASHSVVKGMSDFLEKAVIGQGHGRDGKVAGVHKQLAALQLKRRDLEEVDVELPGHFVGIKRFRRLEQGRVFGFGLVAVVHDCRQQSRRTGNRSAYKC